MKPVALFRAAVILVAAVAALTLLASGPGYRLGAWPFRIGLGLVRWSAYLGIAGMVLAIVGLAAPRLRARSLAAALVVAGAVVGITGYWAQRAATSPRINDISTDTENPPQLAATLPLRSSAENSPAYGGAKLAAEQKRAYPDIAPLMLAEPPRAAFERVQRAAGEMGWRIMSADPSGGRLEAIDRTLWFGFQDDIVVRIVAAEGGSRVDVRSVSRVGRNDIGTNARRVRAFLARLKA